MTEPNAEVAANLERAHASIEAAQQLLAQGHFDFAASRAYYAAFYAATALLLADGLDFGKHSGVIAAIHQRYVKPGRLDKRHGKDLNWLFELRSVADYGVTLHVSQSDGARAIAVAGDFVGAVERLLQAKA